MEFKHACKICGRKFSSGKSMGGHMRSHFAKLPVQPKHASTHQPVSPNAHKTITSALRTDPPSGALNLSSGTAYGSKPQFASSASQFPATALGLRVSARKRSKRNHPQPMMSTQPNAPLKYSKQDEFSSPDILVTVEDVAHCLMMLANDKWSEGVPHPKVTISSNSDDTPKDTIASDSDEEDDVSSESMELRVFGHRCETCKKVFNSYQALGGHMRNHKRPVIIPAVEKREFICNICLKVFPSGQALGGHKKAHLIEKKSTPGNPLSMKKLPVIEINFDSEADSVHKFGSTSTSGTVETSSDTDAYYNAEW